MRLGINGTGLVQQASVAAVTDHARQAAEDGFAHYWLAEHPTGGFDAITVLALVGAQVPDIELGHRRSYQRSRGTLWRLQVKCLPHRIRWAGVFTLGIGLSHEPMMAQLGNRLRVVQIRHLREYLSILMPLLRDGEVDFRGELLASNGRFFSNAGKTVVEVLVAALGPQALAVAGRLAQGTTLAWVGPKTVKDHIVPTISDAAAAEGGVSAPHTGDFAECA